MTQFVRRRKNGAVGMQFELAPILYLIFVLIDAHLLPTNLKGPTFLPPLAVGNDVGLIEQRGQCCHGW
jgi:hypothetical protein